MATSLAKRVRARLPDALGRRLDALVLRDGGHGFDPFGASTDGLAVGIALTRFLYEVYFRVVSHGGEHIPADGPVILAANHSGTLPFDALMLHGDVLRHTNPPRLPRPIADHFVPMLPFVSTWFARCGVVGGSRRNVEALLEAGELLMIFPEGTPGIGKPFRERYRLRTFREGHAELAIRHGAVVVPVAILGAEESMPQLGTIRGVHLFGAPYLPIPATPLPLPTRYHIYYGAPMRLHETFTPAEADDPAVARTAAHQVQSAVQALIDEGLRQRDGIFA
jgi:1-acyl-sn-glycerol-3-phosphate acyltransferase